MSVKPGLFISLDGVDGAGKSTHLEWLITQIQAQGIEVVATREPGGTPLGEQLRELLLHQTMEVKTEALLMFAARNEHLSQVIEPALAEGKWVVCDRFSDASFAYQGGGRQLGVEAMATLENWVHPHRQPDRTWLFDVPLAVAQERLQHAREPDRFEQEAQAFFQRTREAYLLRAQLHPQRIHVIDGHRSIDAIRHELSQGLNQLFKRYHEPL